MKLDMPRVGRRRRYQTIQQPAKQRNDPGEVGDEPQLAGWFPLARWLFSQ